MRQRHGVPVLAVIGVWLLISLGGSAHTAHITSVTATPSPGQVCLSENGLYQFTVTVCFTASGFGPADVLYVDYQFWKNNTPPGLHSVGSVTGPNGSYCLSKTRWLGGADMIGYTGSAVLHFELAVHAPPPPDFSGDSLDLNYEIVACGCTATLTVSTSGNGSVSRSPDKTSYTCNESVTLTANPSLGWTFDHWGGALAGSTNPTSLTMDGNKSVTAYFTQPCSYSLTVLVSPSGKGTVSKSPSKSSYCGGDSVTLTASPSSGWTFDHWGGALTGSTNPATLTMDGNKSVTAYFTQPCSYSLTVSVSPSGKGTVGKSPSKSSYCNGDSVTLTANPSSGYIFDHWGGALAGSTNPEGLTMDGNKSVTAYFVLPCSQYALPPMASLVSPANSALCVNPGADLVWSYPQEATACVDLVVFWRSHATGEDWAPWASHTVNQGATKATPGFMADRVYEWYVQATLKSNAGMVSKSEVRTFTTAGYPTAVPEALNSDWRIKQPVVFSASASSAGGTQAGGSLCWITSYDWNFGDGATASGEKVTHAFAAAGTKTVTLRVKNSAGLEAEAKTYVVVSEATDYSKYVNDESGMPSETVAKAVLLLQAGVPVNVKIGSRTIGSRCTLEDYLLWRLQPDWAKDAFMMLVGTIPIAGDAISGLDLVMSTLDGIAAEDKLQQIKGQPSVWGTVVTLDATLNSTRQIAGHLLPSVSESCLSALTAQTSGKGDLPVFRAIDSGTQLVFSFNNAMFIDDCAWSELQKVKQLWPARRGQWVDQLVQAGIVQCGQ